MVCYACGMPVAEEQAVCEHCGSQFDASLPAAFWQSMALCKSPLIAVLAIWQNILAAVLVGAVLTLSERGVVCAVLTIPASVVVSVGAFMMMLGGRNTELYRVRRGCTVLMVGLGIAIAATLSSIPGVIDALVGLSEKPVIIDGQIVSGYLSFAANRHKALQYALRLTVGLTVILSCLIVAVGCIRRNLWRLSRPIEKQGKIRSCVAWGLTVLLVERVMCAGSWATRSSYIVVIFVSLLSAMLFAISYLLFRFPRHKKAPKGTPPALPKQ
ncbi:MAG: hypothetical protein J6K62_05970 [Clostridia bacterium]|nr:hypothetical protein [Clostridia bacterium]